MPNPNFLIGQMVDDLVSLTIDICGKKQDKQSRFPKWLYSTYVEKIMKVTLEIQEDVFIANSCKRGGEKRAELQTDAMCKCVYLAHLIRLSYEKKWISEKQRDRWVDLTEKLKWKIVAWNKTESNPQHPIQYSRFIFVLGEER